MAVGPVREDEGDAAEPHAEVRAPTHPTPKHHNPGTRRRLGYFQIQARVGSWEPLCGRQSPPEPVPAP